MPSLSKIYNNCAWNKTNATNTFILHSSQSDLPLLQSVTDKDGNELNIDCAGEYSPNEYYVFKTLTPVQPQQSPLTISFEYVKSLSKYESGLFEIEFGLESDKSYKKFMFDFFLSTKKIGILILF